MRQIDSEGSLSDSAAAVADLATLRSELKAAVAETIAKSFSQLSAELQDRLLKEVRALREPITAAQVAGRSSGTKSSLTVPKPRQGGPEHAGALSVPSTQSVAGTPKGAAALKVNDRQNVKSSTVAGCTTPQEDLTDRDGQRCMTTGGFTGQAGQESPVTDAGRDTTSSGETQEGRLPGEANADLLPSWADIVPQARGSPDGGKDTSRRALHQTSFAITEASDGGHDPHQALSVSASSDHVNAKVPKSYVEEILRSLSSIESSSFAGRSKSRAALLGWRSSFKHHAKALVRHIYFDYVVCVVIALNAASIGVQTDYAARNHTEKVPTTHRVMDISFCAIFTLELCLRLYVHGLRFFYKQGWQWNYFDAALVLQQLVEELLNLTRNSSNVMNLSFARVLRILRLVRVMRLVRILRLIRELRMLVTSISASLKSLGWTIILLILLIYTVGLYLTQMVSERLMDYEDNDEPYSEDMAQLDLYFGSVLRTMLSLFEAVTSGLDWDELVTPLSREISPLVAMVLTLYIAFTALAMLNVVTGVFVESVLLSAKMDKDHMLVSNARELFKGINGGAMSLELFESKLDSKEMQEFFRGIDVDPSEARGVFRLLDVDSDGEVDAEEFLSGCIRLRGPAKALETATLIHEVRKLADNLHDALPKDQLILSASPSYCTRFLHPGE